MRGLYFLIWQERLRAAAIPLLLAAVLIGGIGAFLILDSSVVERSSVQGDVASWSRVQTETGSASYVISVTLPDGNSVTATASRYGRAPRIGERLMTGTDTMSINRLARFSQIHRQGSKELNHGFNVVLTSNATAYTP